MQYFKNKFLQDRPLINKITVNKNNNFEIEIFMNGLTEIVLSVFENYQECSKRSD